MLSIAMLFSGIKKMIPWCAFSVSVFSCLVRGSPTLELLEVTSSSFCGDKFHLAGRDYTVLKYNISGANAEFQLNPSVTPRLINIETRAPLCHLIDMTTGKCTQTALDDHECWCSKISSDEYHLTYVRTADSEISDATVAMYWVCDTNTYGKNCAKNCSETCKAKGEVSRCNHIDGLCTFGCEAGYMGLSCHEGCDNKTYGENCKHLCSINCAGTGGLCNPKNGSCVQGCRTGFYGETCAIQENVYQRETTEKNVLYGVVSMMVVLAALFIFSVTQGFEAFAQTQEAVEDVNNYLSDMRTSASSQDSSKNLTSTSANSARDKPKAGSAV
ncbi:multiple epidermal growth factor-like domains 11 [Elysia marginata]|uniref:Multiple epidermal growth factor-like domains 11 n=1 Tax=Elysia marginata TaxID=1093978 RepID=A0AAV4GCX7_9GAST|nr:multiple epidermal growth factor-like domains 11 [Elysia marginata]